MCWRTMVTLMVRGSDGVRLPLDEPLARLDQCGEQRNADVGVGDVVNGLRERDDEAECVVVLVLGRDGEVPVPAVDLVIGEDAAAR